MENPSQATADCHDDDITLPDGWRTILVENNRWFYLHETRKRCGWLPPAQSWISRRGLPYGWELARSNDGRRYYINHVTKSSVRCLPCSSDERLSIPPRTRRVTISRHSDIGYGFVAGSEKPVLIRSVAEDGPSAGKLHANDQILKIDGEDVSDLPQSEVILRIKKYTHELRLEVIASDDVQDVKNQGQRKSSIMSRTTRERRRSNPVNVRFAETPVLVQYVGSPPSCPHRRSSLPLIPNVLKIFLENGQTRSFLYNSKTLVEELLLSLGEKVGLKTLDRFCLVLQASQSLNDSYVQCNERASQIYLRRNCSSSTWLCKLHLVFPPKDIHYLLKEDPTAFDYFYKQMCSQVVEGRFGWELKYETAIKLAALHLQQYALEDKVGKNGKISVKAIEKEVGSLNNFVPNALINTMQKKDLQRVLSQQIKQTRNLCPPGQKYVSPLQAKLQYLKIVSEMKTYGGKQFNAIIVDPAEDPKFFQDQKLPSVIFVGPNVGLSQVTNQRSFSMNQIAEFSQINGLVVTPHTEGKQNLKLFLTNGKSITLILGPISETRDLVYLISGYYKYLVENAKPLSIIDMTVTGNIEESVDPDEVPSYPSRHRVAPDDWSYKLVALDSNDDEDFKDVDFLQKPEFDGSEHYSLVDDSGSEVLQESIKQQLYNGDVNTNLKIQSNNKAIVDKNLECIHEESSSREEDDTSGPSSLDSTKIIDIVGDDLVAESPEEVAEKPLSQAKTVKTSKGENYNITSDQKVVINSSKDDVPVAIVNEVSKSIFNDKLEQEGNADGSAEIVLDDAILSANDHEPCPVTEDEHYTGKPSHNDKPLANSMLISNSEVGLKCNGDDNTYSHLHDVNVDVSSTSTLESPATHSSDDCATVKLSSLTNLPSMNSAIIFTDVRIPKSKEEMFIQTDGIHISNKEYADKIKRGEVTATEEPSRRCTSPLLDDVRIATPPANSMVHLNDKNVGSDFSSDDNSKSKIVIIECDNDNENDNSNDNNVGRDFSSDDNSKTKIVIIENDNDNENDKSNDNPSKSNSNNNNNCSRNDNNNDNNNSHGNKNDMDENNRLCQDVPETACNNSADDASTSPAVVPLNVEHKENNLPNSALTDAFDVKRNDKCDMKAEQARRRRRLSSGFIPSPKMNGDINPNFITHNIRTSVASEETPKGCKEKRKINEGLQNSDYSEVTSRTGACDHALKVLYSLKTKLSSLLHSDCSVRKSNEILRAKKQSMTDGIVVLEECIKQIQHLVMKDEEIVVEAVLRSSRTLSCLTESCEVLYNAQYSMRHFALELVDAIDKLIDVLITTDTWSSTNSSELTVELHKDKCELVGSSLESLRKIINAL